MNREDHYLTRPNEKDVQGLADLAKNGAFFFSPLNSQIKAKVHPFVAAAKLRIGETTIVPVTSLAVRLSENDHFAGCVRFERGEPGQQKLSYFFAPDHEALKASAVLRTLDWSLENLPFRKVTSLIDPEHSEDIRLLRGAGLDVIEDGFIMPEDSPYIDRKNKKRAQLIMEGFKHHHIAPALETARQNQRYSLETLVHA